MTTCAKHIDSTDTSPQVNLSLKERSAKMKVKAAPTFLLHDCDSSTCCRLG
jgi:hypothetical protein